MSVINVGGKATVFGFEHDPIVIRHYEYGVQGGRVLDLTDYKEDFIRAGHVIIKETASGVYKPMPVKDGGYASLPAGHEYVGVCVASAAADYPFVSIMTKGEVNDVACPYPYDGIKSAFNAAVPCIRFDHD